MAQQYELRSYKQPLLKGHQPIPLAPASLEQAVTPIPEGQVMTEAVRLFNHQSCWHITINTTAVDGQGNTLRGTPHWCADVAQVEAWLEEEKQ
jgi:hypothetical protein